MTSITEREPPDGADMGPVDINDRTRITLPMGLSLGALVVGAVLWANSLNVAVAELKRDQANDRYRLQRIEASQDRVESKLDAVKDALRAQPPSPTPQRPETDYGMPRRFDR